VVGKNTFEGAATFGWPKILQITLKTLEKRAMKTYGLFVKPACNEKIHVWFIAAILFPITGLLGASLTLQDGVTIKLPTGTYGGTTDAWVNEGQPTRNYGASPILEIKYDANDAGYAEDHALIKFDLPTLSFDSISRATLEIFYMEAESFQADNALGIKPYRIAPDKLWDENDGEISGKPNEGVNFQYCDKMQTRPWTEQFGGWYDKIDDLNGTNRVKRAGGTPTNAIEPGNWVPFDILPSVIRWYGGATNNGLLLFSCSFEGGGYTCTAKFASSDTNNPPYRPKLTLNYDRAHITWVGMNGSLWDTKTDNWNVGGYLGKFGDNDFVYFDDSAQVGTITITNTGVNPASIIVSNTIKEFLFQGGGITGPGSIIKRGLGTVTLANSNSYTGPTAVQEGSLVVAANNALGTTNAGTTIANGAALAFQTTSYLSREPVTVSGAGPNGLGAILSLAGVNTFCGDITMAEDTIFGVLSSSTLILSNSITGTANFIKNGPGTLILSGPPNTYSGITHIRQGMLTTLKSGVAIPGPLVIGDNTLAGIVRLEADNQLGIGDITLFSGSQLVLANTTNPVTGNLILSNGTVALGTGEMTLSGTIVAGGASTSQITGGKLGMPNPNHQIIVHDTPQETDLEISASISGIGFTKRGPGRLLLSGNNTFTGPVTIGEGELVVSSPTALGSSIAGTTVRRGASLLFQNVAYANPEPLIIEGHGPNGWGAICAISGANSFPGSINFTASTSFGVFSGSILTLSGIITGTGDFIKTGQGQLILSGEEPNSWNGNTMVAQGTLTLAKRSGQAVSGSLTIGDGINPATVVLAMPSQLGEGDVTINHGSTLNLGGFPDRVNGALILNGGTVITGLGQLTLLGPIIATAQGQNLINGFLDLANNLVSIEVQDGPATEDLVISATLRNGGIIKQGTGALVLSSANQIDGPIVVTDGKLIINHPEAVGSPIGETIVTNKGVIELPGEIAVRLEPLTLGGTGLGKGALISAKKQNLWAGSISLIAPSSIRAEALSSLILDGDINIGAFDLELVAVGPITINGAINGGNSVIRKDGQSTLTLGGTQPNTFEGTFVVANGDLVLAKSGAPAITGSLIAGTETQPILVVCRADDQFHPNASVTLNKNSLLNLNGFGATLRALITYDAIVTTHTGILRIANQCEQLGTNQTLISGTLELLDTPTFSVNPLGTLELRASVRGTGFTLVGEGRLLLLNTNNFATPCTAAQGTLLINVDPAAGPVLGPAPLTILNEAKLLGNGLIAGDINVMGGTISPGTSIGTLIVSGDIQLSQGAKLQIDVINSECDVIDLAQIGSLYIDTNFTPAPSLELLGTLVGPDPYIIVRNARTISGWFADLPNGSQIPGQPGWYIHYGQHRIYLSQVQNPIEYFRAFSINSNALVMWRTVEEVEITSYDLYQKTESDWIKVTADPIPAAGPAGGIYLLTNSYAVLNSTNLFRLVAHTGSGDEYWDFERHVTELQFNAPPEVREDGVLIRWSSRIDESYDLQWTPDLTEPMQTIITNIPATPPESSAIHSTTNPAGFYRIRLTP